MRPLLYYVHNTPASPAGRSDDMDFFRNIEPRDWMIAIGAFFAGAFIF
jgi:hypothetical protein